MILKGLVSLAIGFVYFWTGWNNWKHRDTEAIPWIESQIFEALDKQPLPRTKFDRISRRLQTGLGLAFGLFFSFIGLVLILDLGE